MNEPAHAVFPFILPHGLVDPDGTVHREGSMRLATALDEIAPMKDPRVQGNPGYLVIIMLSRVITGLGSLEFITPKAVENLYAGDLAYLQDFYIRINRNGHSRLHVACPHCDGEFEVETASLGEV
ncbi:MAG: hypothetical protein ETSY2_48165 [Candidatus Entotheonella gemina]|uniref:Secreted protein n=1 Tax=Candidatus Entotheonella gemina TaxID=1429439 RepID=W4LBE7_9BACT|nr:MAG: hypothetical protein ETSY2_48165 [Candidatus Entotheonella gemina]